MLGAYGLFEEGNRYSANFDEKLEKRWQKSKIQLKEELRELLKSG
jgi:hypothetical protein